MKSIREFKKLAALVKSPLFSSSDAKKQGVSSSLLNYYARRGLIDKLQRGIYRGKESSLNVDFKYEDLILSAKSIPAGIVCLVSALSVYDLTDEIPREHWIAIPHQDKAPKRSGVKVVRMRNINIGQTEMKIGNQTIKIFNRERTILDAFRYLGKEQAVKTLKSALAKKGKEKIYIEKIRKYARVLRVNIDSYIIAVTV